MRMRKIKTSSSSATAPRDGSWPETRGLSRQTSTSKVSDLTRFFIKKIEKSFLTLLGESIGHKDSKFCTVGPITFVYCTHIVFNKFFGIFFL